jgi:hypothetical protein
MSMNPRIMQFGLKLEFERAQRGFDVATIAEQS